MALVGEYQMFNEWKEFFEGLTVGWLIENYEEGHLAITDQNQCPDVIYTFSKSFHIHGNESHFRFKSPSGLLKLRCSEDELLIKHLPSDVWEDFIRVIEL